MKKKPIIYAFIDSQNLNLGVKGQGWELDYKRFLIYLKDKYKISKAFLFLSYIKANKKLYRFLNNAGYKLVFKQAVISKGKIKGNVDAELIVWAMKSIYEELCKKAVIVSGDGDFAVLASFLIIEDKLLKFISPDYKTASILLKKVFIKHRILDLLDYLNNKKEKLAKK